MYELWKINNGAYLLLIGFCHQILNFISHLFLFDPVRYHNFLTILQGTFKLMGTSKIINGRMINFIVKWACISLLNKTYQYIESFELLSLYYVHVLTFISYFKVRCCGGFRRGPKSYYLFLRWYFLEEAYFNTGKPVNKEMMYNCNEFNVIAMD